LGIFTVLGSSVLSFFVSLVVEFLKSKTAGRKELRIAVRREKLYTAKINRQEYWKAQASNP
jgi:hypothetical protein